MIYKVKRGKPIATGQHRPNKDAMPVPKFVQQWQVVDELGRVYCSEASRELAEKHIPQLETADKRNAEAEKTRLQREAWRNA